MLKLVGACSQPDLEVLRLQEDREEDREEPELPESHPGGHHWSWREHCIDECEYIMFSQRVVIVRVHYAFNHCIRMMVVTLCFPQLRSVVRVHYVLSSWWKCAEGTLWFWQLTLFGDEFECIMFYQDHGHITVHRVCKAQGDWSRPMVHPCFYYTLRLHHTLLFMKVVFIYMSVWCVEENRLQKVTVDLVTCERTSIFS